MRTRCKQRRVDSSPKALESQVRQLLADKISGNQVGIWLLIPEFLRLGVWDLLLLWSGQSTEDVEPRMALHLINESALCLCSNRSERSLSQKGFEVANGLPFVPTDAALHQLLDAHTVAQARQLQLALGKIRRARKHFQGQMLALDAHRILSYSQRQMRRHRFSVSEKAKKMSQTFFLVDCDTHQPVAFTLSSSAQTVTQAAEELLSMGADILNLPTSTAARPLVMADKEHHTRELFETVGARGCFDLLVPMPARPMTSAEAEKVAALPFTEHWAGYATAQRSFRFKDGSAKAADLSELVQRTSNAPNTHSYQRFITTTPRPELPTLTHDYPRRWHIEEFFKFKQALGWDRAGTMNLNVRYGQMSLSLIAQAGLSQLQKRLGEPVNQWDAEHLARQFLDRLEGDIRVEKDTIVVTYYNAPNAELLRQHYENLPSKLQKEGIDPAIPWLYGFKLDFRFK